MRVYLYLSTAFLAACAFLRLWRTKRRWVRVLDFPVLQLAAWTLANITLLGVYGCGLAFRARAALSSLLTVILGMQVAKVLRYTPFAPRQALPADPDRDPKGDFSLLIANILMTNRNASSFRDLVASADPDLVLVTEPDAWWEEQLRPLDAAYPHHVKAPLPNTYGMILYSRLPFRKRRIHHLVHADVPSIHVEVELPSGRRFEFFCVHPRPPSEADTDERDAELLQVARRMRKSGLPGLVAGDLNDVAWSRSTRLFQKEGRMLDPRAGRGLFNTFHAHYPVLRYPLDHVFYSADFTLAGLERRNPGGSDHFPILIRLHLGEEKAAKQDPPETDGEEEREVKQVLAEAPKGPD